MRVWAKFFIRKAGSLLREYKNCEIEGCDKRSRSGKMCSKHYYLRHPNGKKAKAKQDLIQRLTVVNWTRDRWIALNYAQGGLCYICGESDYAKGNNRRLAADHCHKTGEPRALLCMKCNQMLGIYENNQEQIDRYLYPERELR
jgi:hypothetical protein